MEVFIHKARAWWEVYDLLVHKCLYIVIGGSHGGIYSQN